MSISVLIQNLESKNTITEMKILLVGIKSILELVKERISRVEDKSIKIIQSEEKQQQQS